jgi:hypothetical protein
MDFAKAFAIVSFAFGALALAGCSGVQGSYLLDKAEMKKKAEAEVAKLPADQQEVGKKALAVIDGMEMTFDLQSGGKLTVHATTPGLNPGDPNKIEQKEGTWKEDGTAVELTIDGNPVKCTKGEGKLTCEGQNKANPTLVLVKN